MGSLSRTPLTRSRSESFAPTGTLEQYDESVRRAKEQGFFPPEGMDYHVAFIVNGEFRVSEIWDSREALEAFAEHLMPLLAEVGIDPGEPEIFEIHNIVKR
jgi:hypothetical protein